MRTDAVYNPGIGRYLLALGYKHNARMGNVRRSGTLGAVDDGLHTENWGRGGTHGYRLPAKWIRSSGTAMHLIFSGVKLPQITFDAFCVRKMQLDIAGKGPR